MYQNKSLNLDIQYCGSGVHVDVDTPKVDPYENDSDTFGITGFGDSCDTQYYEVQLDPGSKGSADSVDDPDACLSAIDSSPITGQLRIQQGSTFCVESRFNTVAILKVSRAQPGGKVVMLVDAWRV